METLYLACPTDRTSIIRLMDDTIAAAVPVVSEAGIVSCRPSTVDGVTPLTSAEHLSKGSKRELGLHGPAPDLTADSFNSVSSGKKAKTLPMLMAAAASGIVMAGVHRVTSLVRESWRNSSARQGAEAPHQQPSDRPAELPFPRVFGSRSSLGPPSDSDELVPSPRIVKRCKECLLVTTVEKLPILVSSPAEPKPSPASNPVPTVLIHPSLQAWPSSPPQITLGASNPPPAALESLRRRRQRRCRSPLMMAQDSFIGAMPVVFPLQTTVDCLQQRKAQVTPTMACRDQRPLIWATEVGL